MEPPKLEFAFEITIQLSKRFRYGPCTDGMERGHVHVLGGTIVGPRFNGRVVPGTGGDWPVIRPDNTCVFDARYLLEADDGTLIQIRNTGIRHGPREVLCLNFNFAFKAPVFADDPVALSWTVSAVEWQPRLEGWLAQHR